VENDAVSIGIRPMQPDELDEIARLWCRSKQEAYLPWLAIEATYSFEDNLDYFRDTVCANHRVWLAERDGTVVGLMAQAGDFIDQLFVDPDHQRAGVGTALLAWARGESPDGLALHTFRRNSRARRFYEKHGFRAVAFGVSPAPESEPDVRYEWRPEP
jgi:GNAT superfamily N-acetyltransferase